MQTEPGRPQTERRGSKLSRPRVLFFDVGHTLVTGTERSARRLLASRLSLSEKETRRVGRLIMTHPASDNDTLGKALSKILPDRADNFVREALDAVWEEQLRSVREIPGATSVLWRLKTAGYRIGILSNTWHPAYLGFCRTCPGLLELLDFTVLSYRAGCKKPSQDIFRMAVETAGTGAGECWMIGDTYELDVHPAREAGMRAVWLLSRPLVERETLVRLLRGELTRPDWTVETLDELIPFFESFGTT